MRFTTHAASLAAALKVASKLTEKRPFMPILANVRMEARSALVLEATNLDQGLRVVIPAAVADPGALTVPCEGLRKALRGAEGLVETRERR